MGNNPISSIDPDGGWEGHFGAWLHSVFYGGEVFQSEKYGDWGVRSGSASADGVGMDINTSWLRKA